MFNLNQSSIFVATIVATATISTVYSTAAQAAIVSGQVSGTWQAVSGGDDGFKVGDAFTANYL
jgi:hypothetical protein